MCGIFAYLGSDKAIEICIEGLKRLEYRGYDSSGIAGIQNAQLLLWKEVGNISVLEKAIALIANELSLEGIAIAHTRWATHGKADKKNAHPHLDEMRTLALVHNGVIENYTLLKKELQEGGVTFSSDTDTEVVAQLIAKNYAGNLLKAAQDAFARLEGSYAVALIHKDHPDELIATAEKSPLIVGYSKTSKACFLSSDQNALPGNDLDIYFLADAEVACLKRNEPPLFLNKKGEVIQKEAIHQNLENALMTKEKFEHFMLKEIFEQEHTVKDAMLPRLDEKNKAVYFEEFANLLQVLSEVQHIVIVGCGTSWHAAFVAQYFFESIAHISTRAEIASEYRYKYQVVSEKTLVIALSQSGETADTLAAFRAVRDKDVHVIALCNVPGSTLSREADSTIFLHAKQEVAVASTKTFTSQLTILYLMAVFLAQKRKVLNEEQSRFYIKYLYEIPIQITEVLKQSQFIEKLAKKYAHFEDLFFLGRGILYPIALEAALKLKEIAYVNSSGFPAGEMKHGPIALLSEKVPVVVFCANTLLQPKIMSNLMESKARGAPIIVFGWKDFEKEIMEVADDVIWIPKTSDPLACIPVTIAAQLFAYYVAKERGCPIDQPRNLAKSVTVE